MKPFWKGKKKTKSSDSESDAEEPKVKPVLEKKPDSHSSDSDSDKAPKVAIDIKPVEVVPLTKHLEKENQALHAKKEESDSSDSSDDEGKEKKSKFSLGLKPFWKGKKKTKSSDSESHSCSGNENYSKPVLKLFEKRKSEVEFERSLEPTECPVREWETIKPTVSVTESSSEDEKNVESKIKDLSVASGILMKLPFLKRDISSDSSTSTDDDQKPVSLLVAKRESQDLKSKVEDLKKVFQDDTLTNKDLKIPRESKSSHSSSSDSEGEPQKENTKGESQRKSLRDKLKGKVEGARLAFQSMSKEKHGSESSSSDEKEKKKTSVGISDKIKGKVEEIKQSFQKLSSPKTDSTPILIKISRKVSTSSSSDDERGQANAMGDVEKLEKDKNQMAVVSSSSEDEEKNDDAVDVDMRTDGVTQVIKYWTTQRQDASPKRKTSSSSSSDEENKTKEVEDLDAIMKQQMKEYRRSLSPDTPRIESSVKKFSLMADEKSVFKIVRQGDQAKSSSSSSSSSSDDNTISANISLLDCQTEQDVDAVMKAKLKEYKRKVSQKDRKISTEYVHPVKIEKPRPTSLTLSIQHEDEVDPLLPQKRNLGELVSR